MVKPMFPGTMGEQSGPEDLLWVRGYGSAQVRQTRSTTSISLTPVRTSEEAEGAARADYRSLCKESEAAPGGASAFDIINGDNTGCLKALHTL